MVRSGGVPKGRSRSAEQLPAAMATRKTTPTGAIAPANGAILAALAAVPDLVARVAAIELFLHEALGRRSRDRVTRA